MVIKFLSWPESPIIFLTAKREKNCRLARFLLKLLFRPVCSSRNLDHDGKKAEPDKVARPFWVEIEEGLG